VANFTLHTASVFEPQLQHDPIPVSLLLLLLFVAVMLLLFKMQLGEVSVVHLPAQNEFNLMFVVPCIIVITEE